MPELPEVETVVRGLGKHLIGQAIKDIDIRNKDSYKTTTREIKGLKVTKISRRGKGVIINLSKNVSLLIHLKMTGQLIYMPTKEQALKKRLNFGHPTNDFTGEMPSKHTRIIFHLSGGTLYFNDQRKFGWVKLLPTEKTNEDSFIKNLGIEPFSKEFTTEFLWSVIKRRPKSNIKATLLDQSVVVGVGNIYASEILFSAGVNPHKKNNQLNKEETKRIVAGTKQVLKKGIKYSGTSILNYRTPEGSQGKMQNHLMVYSRDKLPCRTCKTIIKKTQLDSRGTYCCPKCQR
ncbi:bifunctional DNA-formamidopyrimidine glycosylase/DNA-(apurinic or apyrimidinic site) lyase [Patescibacteria group bacterium]|nr:bifunctional DNA-formamidopyrimidine glycosylase/DNA-(apurinic or apyrimidinic site) lyase [Patescibacteria group bacterium]